MVLQIPDRAFLHPQLDTADKMIFVLLLGLCPDGEVTNEDIDRIVKWGSVKRKRIRTACARLRNLGLWTAPLPESLGPIPLDPQRPQATTTGRKPGAIKKCDKIALAAQMRDNPTPSEQAMWGLLERQFPGAFKRQVLMFGYIPDFYCKKRKLVVEVDGESHRFKADYDKHRDSVFASRGVRTLRVTAEKVMSPGGLADTADEIRRWMNLPLLPNPRRAA